MKKTRGVAFKTETIDYHKHVIYIEQTKDKRMRGVPLKKRGQRKSYGH